MAIISKSKKNFTASLYQKGPRLWKKTQIQIKTKFGQKKAKENEQHNFLDKIESCCSNLLTFNK